MDETTIMFLAGVVILTASLLLHLRKRIREEAKRKAKRQEEIDAARAAERNRQLQSVSAAVKSGTSKSGRNSTRMPLPEPHDTPFNGAASPRHIAKWETEIHQIGRRMIAQLDSKMVALQTLTLEANRTANRLELMIEHLENLFRERGLLTGKRVGETASEDDLESGEADGSTPRPSAETDLPAPSRVGDGEQTDGSQPVVGAERNLISGAESDLPVTDFAELLADLEEEKERLRRYAAEETVAPATILKAAEFADAAKDIESTVVDDRPKSNREQRNQEAIRRLPSSLSLSTENPLLAETAPAPATASLSASNAFSLSSPGLPGEGFAPARPVLLDGQSRTARSTPPASRSQSVGLSIDSLYDHEPGRLSGAVALGPNASPSPAASKSSRNGSRLELRKQVEMLADYGYTANQIAQNLNITVGEVDLMLSLRSV